MISLLRKVRWWLQRRRKEDELREELEFHLAEETSERQAEGFPENAAKWAARRDLGNTNLLREDVQTVWSWALLDQTAQDIRYALRSFRQSPGFPATAVLTLALGIGVNVFIFSFAYPILTARLPGIDPERLVRIYESRTSNVFYADYEAFRDRTRVLEGFAASQIEGMSIRLDASPQHAIGMVVSGHYFQVLGIEPRLGRLLLPSDDQPGAPGAVVLSDRGWRNRFGGDLGVVGRPIIVNGQPFTVVGVAPADFVGTSVPVNPELWVAWHAPGFAPSTEDVLRRRGRSAQVIGRLKRGQTVRDAQADLAGIAADLAKSHPENIGRSVWVYDGYLVSPELRTQALGFLAILLMLTSLVLVVACVNLAGLQLARGAARQREIGVRLALGAGRGRLMRQLVAESLLLSVLSAFAGVACAVAGAQIVASWSAVLPGGQTLTVASTIGRDAVLFAAGLAILTTTLVGLLPALRASRPDIVRAIHSTPATGPRLRTRTLVVAGQLSLTTVLLVLASVLARSLLEARGIDPGFSPDGILSVSIDVNSRAYSREEGGRYFQELGDRVERVPGVRSAALAELVPLTLSGRSRLVLRDDQTIPTAADRESLVVYTNNVSPSFFATLGIPLLAGRDFDNRDRSDRPNVAIVNETMADRYWPNTSPIGRHFRLWDGMDGVGAPIEVIGLARDSKYVSIGEEQRPFFYRPLAQAFARDVTMLIATTGEPLGLLPALRSELRTFDAELALVSAAPLIEQTRISLLPVQVAASVALSLGFVVLALAAIGTYGVAAYDVRRRTKELAIRVALGANARDVIVGLVRERMWWTTAAVVGGLGAAAVASSILSTLLYGVSSVDPIAFAGVAVVLCNTAFLAAWLPARRAARVDPMVALRCE